MKHELHIHDAFGSRLADGDSATAFRVRQIDPYVGICGEIVLDFTSVRNANSSFMNALVAGLIEQHGARVLKLLLFKGCNPAIKVLIEAAVDLGIQQAKGRIYA